MSSAPCGSPIVRETTYARIAPVGDADPLLAIGDGLHFFEADEIVIATHPAHRSHRLDRNFGERVRSRFSKPVRHVLVLLAVSSLIVMRRAGAGTRVR